MQIYKKIVSIPIIGTIVYIANCYAFGGDPNATRKFASPWAWVKVLFAPLLISSALSLATVWPLAVDFYFHREFDLCTLSPFAKAPGDLIASVIPSLLGFGIGVYALIFALAAPIVAELNAQIETLKKAKLKKHGSALVINSDLAYPLMVLVLSLVVGVFQKGSSSIELVLLGWLAFWYSIVMTFEVIGVLFGLGDQALLDKLTPQAGPSNVSATDESGSSTDQDS